MLKFYLTILLFIVSLFGFTQSYNIDDGDWYLYNLKINSENNFNPLRADGNQIVSTFFTNNVGKRSFGTWICDTWFGPIEVHVESSKINFFGFGTTLGGCDSLEYATGVNTNDIDFKFRTFFSAFDGPKEFTYQITDAIQDTPKTLVITAENGDFAEYHFKTLSTKNYSSNLSFSIYPNPVKDELVINSYKNLSNFNVKIFDLNGKLIQENLLVNTKSIDVLNLKKGFYFIMIEDELGKIGVQKFIK